MIIRILIKEIVITITTELVSAPRSPPLSPNNRLCRFSVGAWKRDIRFIDKTKRGHKLGFFFLHKQYVYTYTFHYYLRNSRSSETPLPSLPFPFPITSQHCCLPERTRKKKQPSFLQSSRPCNFSKKKAKHEAPLYFYFLLYILETKREKLAIAPTTPLPRTSFFPCGSLRSIPNPHLSHFNTYNSQPLFVWEGKGRGGGKVC